ncbi:MAG: type III pantothenate kinase [Lachnospirales bacterium]
MKLVFDVGNTNAVMGVYDEDELIEFWRLATENIKTADEIGMFIIVMFNKWNIKFEDIDDVIVSSVVPNIMYSLLHGIQKYFNIEAKVISVDGNTGLDFSNMQNPYELGADRIVNCMATHKLYTGPAIIIDYGTATTYDVIDGKGKFITGVTAPGLRLSADALFQGTALLGKVAITKPASIIATDTITSVQAGLLYGHIGQSEYIIKKIKSELGKDFETAKIIATGGLSKVIGEGTEIFDEVNSRLTLYGIKLYGDLNS